jgi:DNA-binding NarL/FixJ family response regulator
VVASENNPIRVGLVDDEQLVRMGLKLLFNSQPDLQVVAEAVNGQVATETFAGDVADVVVMDVRMPVLDGPSATAKLTQTAPNTRVIILTSWDTDEYVLHAIRAGAAGFLLKDAPPEEILTAVRRVAGGDAVIAPSATKRLLTHFASLPAPVGVVPAGERNDDEKAVAEKALAETAIPQADSRNDSGASALGGTPAQQRAIASLTARELEVLKEMAAGLSNQEISAKLFVSEATTKTHVSRILTKLDARDRVQAVIVAYETGLA